MALEGFDSEGEQELLLVVERLSTQDRRRIVHLIELLVRAPGDLRVAGQRKLRQFLAGESMSHDECCAGIDSVLAGIERELGNREAFPPERELPQPITRRVAASG